MAKRTPKIYIGLGIMVLILAMLACGSVQVGVVAPTLEGSMQPTNNAPEPETDLAVLEDVDSQIEDEPTPEPTAEVPEELNPHHGLPGSGPQCVGTSSGQRDTAPGDL